MKNFRSCFCFVSFGLSFFKDYFLLEHMTGYLTFRKLDVKKRSRKAQVFPSPYLMPKVSSRWTKRSGTCLNKCSSNFAREFVPATIMPIYFKSERGYLRHWITRDFCQRPVLRWDTQSPKLKSAMPKVIYPQRLTSTRCHQIWRWKVAFPLERRPNIDALWYTTR